MLSYLHKAAIRKFVHNKEPNITYMLENDGLLAEAFDNNEIYEHDIQAYIDELTGNGEDD